MFRFCVDITNESQLAFGETYRRDNLRSDSESRVDEPSACHVMDSLNVLPIGYIGVLRIGELGPDEVRRP